MGIKEQLEKLGIDADTVLAIVYGPLAREGIQGALKCDRREADFILEWLRETA